MATNSLVIESVVQFIGLVIKYYQHDAFLSKGEKIRMHITEVFCAQNTS